MKPIQILFFFLFISSCKTNHNNSRCLDFKSNLKVMTYNIRLDVASDGDNAWPNRKEFLSSQVLFLGPDVMGVQEALSNQIKDLNNLLKDYKLIGHGRDGGDNGEYSAIYYNIIQKN